MRDSQNPMQKKGKATDLSRTVADMLFGLRTSRKLSQREFAECMDVSFQQYQKYEKAKDRVSLEKIILLCRKLDISFSIFDDHLLGFSETPQALLDSEEDNGRDKHLLLALYKSMPPRDKKKLLETAQQLGTIASDKN
jgi:transcriptional regulator with XRE-family HTH domain